MGALLRFSALHSKSSQQRPLAAASRRSAINITVLSDGRSPADKHLLKIAEQAWLTPKSTIAESNVH